MSVQLNSMRFPEFIDYLYEFYTHNSRGRYLAYTIILLLDSVYIWFNDSIVGRPVSQVSNEVAVLTASLGIIIPLLYFPFAKSALIQSKAALSLIFALIVIGISIVIGSIYLSARTIVKNKKAWPVSVYVNEDSSGDINQIFEIQFLSSQEREQSGRDMVVIRIISPNYEPKRLEFDSLGSRHNIHVGERTFDITLMSVKNSVAVFTVAPSDRTEED